MIRFQPHAYQIEAMKFLLGNSHAGLFMDPGLGKTAVVLGVLRVLKERRMFRRALVVAPMRVATNVWPAEKMKWADFAGSLSLTVLHGPKKQKMLSTCDADIVVVTPEGLQWLAEIEAGYSLTNMERLNCDVLIVDESSFFRHNSSQRFKTLRHWLTTFKRRIILTATPAPLGYMDLWTQAYILDRGGALEPYITRYRGMYFSDMGYAYPDWKLNPGSDERINAKMKPLVLRGDQVDHLDMPKLVHSTIPVTLPPEAMATYKVMEEKFYMAIEGTEITAVNTAILGSKLRQIANGFVYGDTHFAQHIHNAKIDALMEFIDTLGSQPALVLYEFDADRDAILNKLKGVTCLTGLGTAAANQAIEDFNAGRIPVLLCHPASAGHGLNLQDKSNHIIWYGPTWNLEHHIQAIARVWRQGNPHERVFVHTLVAMGTKDQDVVAVLDNKDATQKALLESLKPQDVVSVTGVAP